MEGIVAGIAMELVVAGAAVDEVAAATAAAVDHVRLGVAVQGRRWPCRRSGSRSR
jgi:hypothetical protein